MYAAQMNLDQPATSAPTTDGPVLESVYWDPSTMGSLNATSSAAIERLRAYAPPPFPLWHRLPHRRRAAVLMLLYPDRWGHLRLVITMRSASLRNFPSEAAFPGGKADSVDETPYQTARRETWEEIGLPAVDNEIPPPFRIEHLCFLPHHLARTDVVVRPCVALLRVEPVDAPVGVGPPDLIGSAAIAAATAAMAPRPDAREVAAVFSASFEHFLSTVGEGADTGIEAEVEVDKIQPEIKTKTSIDPRPPAGHWYDGSWMTLRGMPWRVHNYYVPIDRQRVARGDGAAAAVTNAPLVAETHADGPVRYRVWGLTARMLLEAARIAYDRDPEQEHNVHFGDEDIIAKTLQTWELLTGGSEDAKM